MSVYARNSGFSLSTVRAWQWPNILSLDAAVIAVVWQQVLGGAGAVAALVLGLSVWLVYVADHWLDVRGRPLGELLTQRHRAVAQGGRWLVTGWLVLLAVDIGIAFTWLTPTQLQSGFVLLVLCLGYLAASQVWARVPKELLVALIFTGGAAVFLPLRANLPELFAGMTALFLLAFGNCSLIAAKETATDRLMGHHSLARQWPGSRGCARIGLAAAVVLGAVLATVGSARYIAVSLAALCLLCLGRYGERLPAESFRVLADGALLLPALGLLL